jgi:hypothetical protein
MHLRQIGRQRIAPGIEKMETFCDASWWRVSARIGLAVAPRGKLEDRQAAGTPAG